MKYVAIILISTIFSINDLYAQNEVLLDKPWKINEYKGEFRNKNFHFFHSDSINNEVNYSKTEYLFAKDGNYQLKDGNNTYTGKWSVNAKGDSITLEGKTQHLVKLDDENLIMRRYTLEFADTAANLDTVYYYLHFKSARQETVTSIEYSPEAKFSFYPNPTKGFLKVELEQYPQAKQILLTNLSGQVVKSVILNKKRKTLEIDIHELPEGIYTAEVQDADCKRVAITRIIKE